MKNNVELRFLTVQNTATVNCSIAIAIGSDSSPRLTHVTAMATGSGETDNYGVYDFGSLLTTISQSKLSGSTNSLWQSTGMVNIAFTQLLGPVRGNSGPLRCFNNYSWNMAPVTCP